jgi:hypothetical protein
MELVKLTTLLRVDGNLGLKAALSQTRVPGGTDWLLKWVVKQTFLPQAAEDCTGFDGIGTVVLEKVDAVGGDDELGAVDGLGGGVSNGQMWT